MREITLADVEYAKRVVHSMPTAHVLGIDDAIGEGLLGLWRAALAYSDSHEATFYTYAYVRIRGAVLDAARSEDHLERAHRERVGGAVSEFDKPARYLEDLWVDRTKGDAHWSWNDFIAGDGDGDVALRMTIDEAVLSVEGRAGAALRMVLLHDVPQVEVAAVFGISVSRVSQLMRDACAVVRHALAARSSAELLEA